MGKNAEPLTRAATLVGFGDLARQFGVDPIVLLKQAKLPPSVLIEPDLRIESRKFNHLIELAANACACEDFGLRLTELRGFSNLGPVTLLARDEPDIRSALAIFIAYLPLHSEALDISLALAGDVAILQCRILTPGPVVQSTDVTVAMLHRILRQLLGSQWTPQMVALERLAPPAHRSRDSR